jgi:hypothetical protein
MASIRRAINLSFLSNEEVANYMSGKPSEASISPPFLLQLVARKRHTLDDRLQCLRDASSDEAFLTV